MCVLSYLLSVLHSKVLVDSNHKHDYLREVKKGKRRYDHTSPPKPRIAKQVVRKICTADRTQQSSRQELNRNKDSKEYELPSLLSTNSSNSKSKKSEMR